MRVVRSFVADRQGTFPMILALAMPALLGCIGVAVDYSRASQARAALQSALDSTVLALAKEAPKSSEAQLLALGSAYFAALMGKDADIALGSLKVGKQPKSVEVSLRGTVKTSFAALFGWPQYDIDVRAASAYGTRRIEVALVLDNTGSMQASNKIGELKKASHTLVTMLEAAAAGSPDQVKIAIVPYTTRVNLGTAYKNETWLTNQPTGTFMNGYNRPAMRNDWQGCVADRDAPYNRTTKAAGIAIAQSLYPMVNCTDGVARAQPLTSNWTLLRSRIDAMQASGMTNITLGAQWGFEMLSGTAPFSETFGTAETERFMILLTDGNNTQDRWGAWDETRMNTDTRGLCDAITERGVPEAAKKHRIRLYTVLVINGNEPLLRDCASNPTMFMKVKQANQLESVFKKIADDIGTIRLTM